MTTFFVQRFKQNKHTTPDETQKVSTAIIIIFSAAGIDKAE
jgi:hypothetical protein